MSWDPDYLAEWQRRARLRNDCLQDEKLRGLMHLHYRKNPIDWIEDWAVTFDPRRKGSKVMPFLLFKRQREYITFLVACWQNKENGLTEKSRDIGATWLCCAFSVWLWLYHPGSVIGWGSRKSDYVDKMGDPKAIFPKIRQIMRYLPDWMMPAGWNVRVHSVFMRIINPQNESAITGESGDNMGRGGRTTIYFKDESAHYEHPELVEAALGDNTDVQIDISSVNGSANMFYRRRMAGIVWYPDKCPPPGMVRVFIFDWSDHPNKTLGWYKTREEKARREGMLHIFRQEVCRDYAGSQERVIIQQEWVEAAIDAHIVLGMKDGSEHVAGQDVADGGGDKNALNIRYGVITRYCHAWGGEAAEAARLAVPHCITHGVREINYDSIGVGSSFKSECNTMKRELKIPPAIRVRPWNAGGSVVDPEKHIIPTDKESPINKDMYANLRAQAWFMLGTRFYKTFRAVKHGEKYDHAELISLDSGMEELHELKAQLSQAVWTSNSTGKTLIDKMPDGSISPNLADAMVICYCPDRKPAGLLTNLEG